MSASEDIDDSTAPLIEHLAELRTRLIRAAGAFIVGIVLAFTVAEPILQFLLGPIEETLRNLGDPAPTLQYTSPQEYLFTLFRISMVFGFALSFPVIGFQLWRFVAPGLYKTEKNAFLPFLIASPMMFLLGASFAHFVVTPLAMAFFLGFADVSSIFANLMSGAVSSLPADAAVVLKKIRPAGGLEPQRAPALAGPVDFAGLCGGLGERLPPAPGGGQIVAQEQGPGAHCPAPGGSPSMASTAWSVRL